MSDRGWSTLATDTPTDTDRVAMQRGGTNLAWTFLELVTFLKTQLFAVGPNGGTQADELVAFDDTSGIILRGTGTLIGNVIRNNVTTQIDGDVGYTGINQALAPGATETPTPSAGHYRNLVGGSTSLTPPAMTETSWVSWTFDVTIYTIDTSNYQVLGTVPSAGTHTLVFDNFGSGPQTATWFNQT